MTAEDEEPPIDYSDIPPSSPEQLAIMRRVRPERVLSISPEPVALRGTDGDVGGGMRQPSVHQQSHQGDTLMSMSMKESRGTVGPALDAVAEVREEIKKRVGKEGGTLNRMVLGRLATIEATLLQMNQVGSMINLINQQTEVAVRAIRAMSEVKGLHEAGNGDDGTSETKGE